jgi:phosphatidylglycerophosphate synthase
LISRIRKRSEKIILILSEPFIACRLPPLVVSLLALPFAFLFAFFVLQGNFLAAFISGLIAALMDLIDGAVARKNGKASLFGNYLDAVIDKAVDFVLIGCFVLIFPVATVIALGGSFLASYAKPRIALVIVTDNRDWPGIGERADKIAALLAGVLVAAFKPVVFEFSVIQLTLLVVALISLIGLFQRIAFAKKLIIEAQRKGTVLPYLKEKTLKK